MLRSALPVASGALLIALLVLAYVSTEAPALRATALIGGSLCGGYLAALWLSSSFRRLELSKDRPSEIGLPTGGLFGVTLMVTVLVITLVVATLRDVDVTLGPVSPVLRGAVAVLFLVVGGSLIAGRQRLAAWHARRGKKSHPAALAVIGALVALQGVLQLLAALS